MVYMFHEIDSNNDQYMIASQNLATFLSWLATRQDVAVRRVDDVMRSLYGSGTTGAFTIALSVHDTPPPSSLGRRFLVNLVYNLVNLKTW